MICNQWDIVLLPFPFTDLTSSKRRPAIVISPLKYNTGMDTVFMYLTSKISVSKHEFDHVLIKWEESNLPLPTMCKMKFMTLDRDFIIKKLGQIQKEDEVIIKSKMKELFKL
jgi:mRNA interferase MazF